MKKNTAKNGLQKFSVSETTADKINGLMKLEKITHEDLKKTLTTREELDEMEKFIADKFKSATADEQGKFFDKIEDILTHDTKSQIFESNHFFIIQSMSNYVEEYGKFPTVTSIANATGLSRRTVHKHMKTFDVNEMYEDQRRKIKIMRDRVLAKVLRMAVQEGGNVKAARLYLEATGGVCLDPYQSGSINTQNNYIQINEVKITQDAIQQLPDDQRSKIEEILKVLVIPQQQKIITHD